MENGADSWKAFTAFAPSSAGITSTPCMVRISVAISMLIRLSSASSTLLPFREKVSPAPSSGFSGRDAFSSFLSAWNGTVRVKTVPFPRLLSTWISPLICVTRFFTIGMPSPVPVIFWEVKRVSLA